MAGGSSSTTDSCSAIATRPCLLRSHSALSRDRTMPQHAYVPGGRIDPLRDLLGGTLFVKRKIHDRASSQIERREALNERTRVDELDVLQERGHVELLGGDGCGSRLELPHAHRSVATRAEHEAIESLRILDAPLARGNEYREEHRLDQIARAFFIAQVPQTVKTDSWGEPTAHLGLRAFAALGARASRRWLRADEAQELCIGGRLHEAHHGPEP